MEDGVSAASPTLGFGLWTLDSQSNHVSKSCWKFSCDFKSGATMTIGRSGNNFCSRAAKNGCAEGQTPAQDSAPPFSIRRARDCTAGAFEMSANKPPAADAAAFCAKQREVCSGIRLRQAAFAPGCCRLPTIICSLKHQRTAGSRCADIFPGPFLSICRRRRRLCPKKTGTAAASSPPPIQPWRNWFCSRSTSGKW